MWPFQVAHMEISALCKNETFRSLFDCPSLSLSLTHYFEKQSIKSTEVNKPAFSAALGSGICKVAPAAAAKVCGLSFSPPLPLLCQRPNDDDDRGRRRHHQNCTPVDETDARKTTDGRTPVPSWRRGGREADTKRRGGGRPFYSRKCRPNEGTASERGRPVEISDSGRPLTESRN